MDNAKLVTLFVISSFLVLPSSSELNYPLVKWILKEKCSKDSKVQCIMGVKYEIEKWLEENSKFSILVVGKIGSGKTTLVRGLTKNYTKTDEDYSDSLDAHTLEVAHYEYEHEGMKLSIYDTPGLSEKENGTLDFEYLDEMSEHEINPDLIVYTVKMDTAAGNALSAEDIKVMKRVSDTFGRARWKFSIFVLTFANKVYKSKKSSGRENKHLFGTVLTELRYQIRNTLDSFNVKGDITDSMPIFPIGLVQQPTIASYDEDKSWVDEFWNTSVKILQKAKAQKKLDEEKIKQGECCACPSKVSQKVNNNDENKENDQDKEVNHNKEETLPNQAESVEANGNQNPEENQDKKPDAKSEL